MGVLHADLKVRDSLALDLMEAVRPKVDAHVLGLLRSHTFAAKDFVESRQGVVRVLPPLTHRLAETEPVWARAVAPLAEGVARALFRPEGRTAQRDRTMPTRLTEANRCEGREAVRRREPGREMADRVGLPPACKDCGVVLDAPERAYCDGCLPGRREEAVAIFAAAGPTALAELRARGSEPAHGGDAGRNRGERNAEHVRTIAAWERKHDGADDPGAFARDVLPHLRGIPLRAMAEATGLSEGYCSFVRRGQKVPHRRHWAALARLGSGQSR